MRKRRKEVDEELAFVRRILRGWDPIGVLPDSPGGPVDEYDSYAPHIVTLLRRGARPAELADELERIRTQPIGLPHRRSRDEEVARSLFEGWHELALSRDQPNG